MNYRKDIENCIDYIEEHIKEPLTLKEITQEIGYSSYHFCRVFSFLKGMPLMEYVRKRRLSLSTIDLLEGKKIIDVAFKWGFETPSSFARAFRKEFGCSPTQYIKKMKAYYKSENNLIIGKFMNDPYIVKKHGFKVAGYGIKTNVADSKYTKDVASFWSNYNGENLESKLYKILSPLKHGEVGLCIPCSDSGDITYLLGVIVEDFSKVTSDMITVEVPEAQYAVFTTNPVNTVDSKDQREFAKIIKQSWKYIFDEWFKNNDYEYDEEKLDFEFYDERCHLRPDTVMDIYVPIKKLER